MCLLSRGRVSKRDCFFVLRMHFQIRYIIPDSDGCDCACCIRLVDFYSDHLVPEVRLHIPTAL